MAEAPMPVVPALQETQAEEPQPAEASSGPAAAPESVQETMVPSELVDATEDEGTLLCGTCRRPTDAENSIVTVRASEKRKQSNRCKSCHSSRAAIARLQKKHGSLVQEFNDLDVGTQESFFRDHANLRGDALKVQLQSTIEDYRSCKTYMSFEGTGEYYDLEDLQKRYEGKPTQLANMVEKTHKFFDHVRGVWLYEDCKYVRKTRDEEERGTSIRRKAKTPVQGDVDEGCPSGSRGGTAAPAQGQAKKKAKKAQPSEPKLKAGQLKKLGKKGEQLKEKRLTLLDLVAQAKQLAEMIPAYVTHAAEQSIAQAIKVETSLLSMIDDGHGNFEQGASEVDGMVNDLADNVSRVSTQIEHAKAYQKQT